MAQADRQTDRHTHTHTDGHCYSKTKSAQWADSVKIRIKQFTNRLGYNKVQWFCITSSKNIVFSLLHFTWHLTGHHPLANTFEQEEHSTECVIGTGSRSRYQ